MFKKRIDEWQLHKNVKAVEKEAILRSMKQHEKLGVDLGQPMLKGKVLELHRLERYRKEKRKFDYLTPGDDCSIDDGRECSLLFTSDTKLSMVNAARHATKRFRNSCQSSLAHISFSRIDNPTQYRNAEYLLFQLDHYYSSKLANDPLASFNAWVESSTPPGGAVYISCTFQGVSRTCEYTDPWDIFGRYSSMGRLLDYGQQKAAWRQAYEGAEMVRTCLQTESPRILRDIVSFWANTSLDHYSDLSRQLLRQFSGMATIIYGKHHPVSIVCRALHTLQPDYNVIALAQRKLLDIFKQSLGDCHMFSVVTESAISNSWIVRGEYDEAERLLSQSFKNCELRRGRHDVLTCQCLYELARLSFGRGRYAEAEGILVDVLQRPKDGGNTDLINFLANELLGIVYCLRGNFDAAEAHLWTALLGTLLQYGPHYPWTTEIWMAYLEVRRRQWMSEGVTTSEDDGVTFCRASRRSPGRFSHPRAQSLPPKRPDWEPYHIWDEAPV
jgi:tetratricopeptide (TPR) repeat protein